MQRFAWFGAACMVSVGVLAACSSPASLISDDGSGGSASSSHKDGGASNYTRDGSVYDSSPSPSSGLGQILFRPNRVYTGTDGTHAFRVPVAVYDADADLQMTASDPSGVTLAPTKLTSPVSADGVTDNGAYFMVTARKPGAYTLTATSKGRSTTATLQVSDYGAGRYAAGQARYTRAGTGADRSCTDCHVNGAAVDHSPAALATSSDQDVAVIITTGVINGPGGPSVIKIASDPGTLHKWNVTDDERDGLVTYLRALDPRGFE